MFNKNVELDLIRLHYPYNNSNILVNLLAILLKKLKFRRITRRLFRKMVIKSIKKFFINNKTNKIIKSNKQNVGINSNDNNNIINSSIPSFLTGLHIKIGGRLLNLSMKSRKTVNIVERGSSSIGKVNYTDFARYTNKNKRGAYSITVSSGQNFF